MLRGRGTAGQRIAGVRTVDARTGAAPGVRAVLTLWGARAVSGNGLARLNRRSLRRVAAQREAAQARLKALHAQGETDRRSSRRRERASRRAA